jgi:hypothetical protein
MNLSYLDTNIKVYQLDIDVSSISELPYSKELSFI